MALPTTTPSSPVSCLFSGKNLEQTLPHGSDYVYVFGLEYSGTFTPDPSFTTNGLITATTPSATKVLGFFKNANHDRESSEFRNSWTRNNKYVLANKIYYRASGSGAREVTRGIEFVPVIFDDEEDGEEPDIEHVANGRSYPLGVYDLLGRCVATEEEVKDGSWRQHVAPGIYIIHGKKVMR